jgi:hypothetical protein
MKEDMTEKISLSDQNLKIMIQSFKGGRPISLEQIKHYVTVVYGQETINWNLT